MSTKPRCGGHRRHHSANRKWPVLRTALSRGSFCFPPSQRKAKIGQLSAPSACPVALADGTGRLCGEPIHSCPFVCFVGICPWTLLWNFLGNEHRTRQRRASTRPPSVWRIERSTSNVEWNDEPVTLIHTFRVFRVFGGQLSLNSEPSGVVS